MEEQKLISMHEDGNPIWFDSENLDTNANIDCFEQSINEEK